MLQMRVDKVAMEVEGEQGVVIAQNPSDRTRPLVRLIAGPGGRRLKRPIDVDLLTDRDRFIVQTRSRQLPEPE